MNDLATPVALTAVARIGIHSLPSLTDSMIAGGLYVLIAETPTARFPILAASLGNALKSGMTSTVIVPSNPTTFIERIESFDETIALSMRSSNRLHFFTMQDEFSKKIFQFGVDGFVHELEAFDVPENSYLVFDQADELLSLHDVSMAADQVDILRKWSERHHVTVLLVFTRTTTAHASTLNALMDNLTGITRLGADKDGLELTFDYWHSQEGTVAARTFRLLTLESGLYEASTKTMATEQEQDESGRPPEENSEHIVPRYYYMDPDLGSLATQMKGTWHQVDTLVGMMHATRNTRTATAILSYQRDTNLRQLAEAVHTLRLSLGRQARIVVQEKGASLRYQNEALLLRLGVNLVVNRDVPSSRLPLLLDSLKGQIFARDVDINFEAALNSVLPTRLHGYLSPLRFAKEVENILVQGDALDIPSAMVIGMPAPGTPIADILAIGGLSRPGDLITADNEFCYMFLNACPQAAMLATLERILGNPVDIVFQRVRFLVQREEMQFELSGLTRMAELGQLPDYQSLMVEPPQVALTEAESLPAQSSQLITTFDAVLPSDVSRSEHPLGATTPNSAPRNSTTFSRLATTSSETVQAPNAHGTGPTRQPERALFSYSRALPAPSFGRKMAPRAARSQAFIDTANAAAPRS